MKIGTLIGALGLEPSEQQVKRARDLVLRADLASYEASQARSRGSAETWSARARALRHEALEELRKGSR